MGFLKTDYDSYVVAKLNASGDEDINSNGKGVCDASLVLYKVSALKKNKKDSNGRKKLVSEPK